jgi:signal peptidase I
MAHRMNGLAILRRGLDLALFVVIGLVIFTVLLGRVAPLTGRETLIIGGGSMEPQIHLGAAVVIEPVTPTDLRVGDIVSLRSGSGKGTIFTHRITRIVDRPDGLWIETKGDANPIVDPSMTPTSEVVGRVEFDIPYAGYLLRLLSLPSGILMVVCLAGLLLGLAWFVESIEGDVRARRRRSGSPLRPVAVPWLLPAGRPTAARQARWMSGGWTTSGTPNLSGPARADQTIE